MENIFDFYKWLRVDENNNIIDFQTNQVCCKNTYITALNLPDKILKTLYYNGIDQLSKLILVSTSLLEYYDLSNDEIIELYSKFDMYIQTNKINYITDKNDNRDVDNIKIDELSISTEPNNNLKNNYDNIEIEKLNLSTRSYNALKNNGIDFISDLLKYDELSLRKINNLGTKSIKEILIIINDLKTNNNYNFEKNTDYVDMFFNKKNFILYNNEICLNKEKLYVYDVQIEKLNLPKYILKYLKKENINVLSELLSIDLQGFKSFGICKYQIVKDACITYLRDNLVDENNINDALKKRTSQALLELIESSGFEGIERKLVIEKLSNDFSTDMIIECIEKLLEDKTIFLYEEDKLFYKYESFPQFLYKLEKGRQKDIMYSRLEGITLEELSLKYNTSRERIRQIQKKFIEKNIVSNGKVIKYFKEDKYQFLFENYKLSKEEFIDIFNEKERTYYYLKMRYNSGNKNLNDALEDDKLPKRFKSCIQKFINKNFEKDYIYIGNDAVRKNFHDILVWYIVNNCNKQVRIDDVYEETCKLIKKLELDISIPDNCRVFEGHLDRINVVQSLNKKIRYYNYSEYDLDRLVLFFNIEEKNNIIISSKYFYDKYSDLMKEYNILDYYELHNILRRYYANKNSKIIFDRMPNMHIGEFNAEEYIKNILIENGPMTIKELTDYLVYETGCESWTVLQWINRCSMFKGYGKMSFNESENLSQEEENYLQFLCNDYIILKNEILEQFNLKFPDKKLMNLPNYLVHKFGYTSNSNYIVKNPYNGGNVFLKLIENNDIINLDDYKKYMINIGRFYNSINKLMHQRDIIEFEEGKCIKISKLEEMGITKNNLDEYVKECVNATNGEYFNIKYLNNIGFTSELYDLGFDDLFYENIIKFNENIMYFRFCGRLIAKYGNENITRTSFIQSIISKYQKITVDDLLKLLNDEYGIKTDKFKINEIIKDTSIYYNNIMDKYYDNYQIFLEEI